MNYIYPLSSNFLDQECIVPIAFPLLEALFKGCLLNHCQLICHICDDFLYCLNSSFYYHF